MTGDRSIDPSSKGVSETLSPRSRGRFRLSKSRFLSALQCQKRLYLELHNPELATPADPDRQALMDMGTEVGNLARRRYPGGILVEETHRQTSAALQRTAELIQDPNVPAIFEGAFVYRDTLVRVDILERLTEDSWRLIEVKATSKVKGIHLHDLTIQTAVLLGQGIAVAQSCLMHLNTNYVYQGEELDLAQLFTLVDLTETVRDRQSKIDGQLEGIRQILESPVPPDIQPDGHCHTPYVCPFWEYCTKDKPPRWIFYLPGGNQIFTQLTAQGIRTIDEIPSTVHLTVLQQRIRDNVEWISSELLPILQSVTYPVHHLDFETFMPAIPIFPNTRPYCPIPIQWSNHIEYEDGTIQHKTYLCREARDPRKEVAHGLLEILGNEGSICVYSDYERHLLLTLGNAFPSLKPEISRVIDRLWDLLHVIQNHYYHPEFQGSFSIKSVLPALVPHLAYNDLEIRHGALASMVYRKMVFEETDLVERLRMAQDLYEYCARDTQGMLEVRRVLHQKASRLNQTQNPPTHH